MDTSDSSYVLPTFLQPHYCRYMEDTFSCFTKVLTNLKHWGVWKSDTPNIKLIVEYPNHYHLPFIDYSVTINQDNLSTSIYIKNIQWPQFHKKFCQHTQFLY